MAQDEIGVAFRDVLSPRQRRALAAAGAALLDEWFDAIGVMTHGDAPPHEAALAAALPPSYRPRLTPALSRRFHTCLTTVLWKLGLACLAEELVPRAMIDRAIELLGSTADVGAVEDDAVADADHEDLFIPRWDGVEGSEAGRALGIGPLGLEACFSVYASSAWDAVHPNYVGGALRPA